MSADEALEQRVASFIASDTNIDDAAAWAVKLVRERIAADLTAELRRAASQKTATGIRGHLQSGYLNGLSSGIRIARGES